MKQHAPSAERNKAPILRVLRDYLPHDGRVLEVASGTGQHITYFALHARGLVWQPSDLNAGARASIDAYREEMGLDNVLSPVVLDASQPPWGFEESGDIGAIVNINMIHISPWAATQGLITGAAQILNPGGVLFLYGPYAIDGSFNAPSNADFDRSLRSRDPEWGIRDLSDVTSLAVEAGFQREAVVDMPANNYSVVFRRWGA